MGMEVSGGKNEGESQQTKTLAILVKSESSQFYLWQNSFLKKFVYELPSLSLSQKKKKATSQNLKQVHDLLHANKLLVRHSVSEYARI